jgi:copper(I)-binding protein
MRNAVRQRLIVLLCLPFAALAQGARDIEIDKAWSRATAPGAKIAAGYMVVRNKAARPDRLLGASSAAAAKVELHVTLKDGEVLRMREVKAYDVPAKGSFELKPGGAHMMLVDIKRPFKEGEKVPVTLRFEHAGEVKTELLVSKGAPSTGHHH